MTETCAACGTECGHLYDFLCPECWFWTHPPDAAPDPDILHPDAHDSWYGGIDVEAR